MAMYLHFLPVGADGPKRLRISDDDAKALDLLGLINAGSVAVLAPVPDDWRPVETVFSFKNVVWAEIEQHD